MTTRNRPEVIRPDWPAPANVRALVTTRQGGVSRGAWATFNLGAHCGDRAAAVHENRHRLRRLLPDEPMWLAQEHGNRVVSWRAGRERLPRADAAVASGRHEVLAVLTADCLPVLFCDERGRQVAVAHAGWRGLAAGVLEQTVAAMRAAPAAVLAWLGPAIGGSVYEVGSEVRDAVCDAHPSDADGFEPHGERWLANLEHLAAARLRRCGLRQVYCSGSCTFTDAERFFSHRRDGVTGRMASVIWLD
ncbi:MAG: peptidoglycan editing factor PgeF [Xanthomonadales bacterium]|nr:peptidoglycan editing factor PgeF [Xanthomonadales bacterium]NIN59721.1 peptidoglycan editing factor PgeF [Xanthomonadales bacterium]NIN75490.1 peptidoglycan editing factor PgeF [Xanthomonadales bacterium]NIO15179.1 peptidoglycan editing factor PgeF [Xanthomonadales bacterium]NIP12114.1 peptidoglycan editing factor PgeF [Xanthomonadales bacterium]